jgi:hypothetical protein
MNDKAVANPLYFVGQTVVSLNAMARGTHKKVGIIVQVGPNPNFPYLVYYTNGWSCHHSENEILPVSWYLNIRQSMM